MDRQKQIWHNFLKVLLYALVEPLQLATLGLGVFLSLMLPQSALLIVSLSFVSVFIRTLILVNDQNFIQKTLIKSKQIESNFVLGLIEEVNKRSKEVRFSSAVEQDLQEAKKVLQKMSQSWESLSPEQVAGSIGVIKDLVQRLVLKLLDLSKQESSARNFLKQFNQIELANDLTNLTKQLKSTADPIARDEYQKALSLKQKQKDSLDKIQNNLERIDSYNARIIAELENTQTYLARLGISNTTNLDFGQTDYLSAELQELSDDIDRFESVNLEVGLEVRKMVEKDIQNSQKI